MTLKVFVISLHAGMPCHILVDAGPLGPLGIMGPLGPHGATGLEQSKEGHFLDSEGKVVESISVDVKDQEVLVPLYELYNEEYLSEVNINDAFFAYFGSLSPWQRKDFIKFSSQRDQWVSILLIGEHVKDYFGLTLKSDGKVITHTQSVLLNNFIVFKVKANTKFEINVSLIIGLDLDMSKGYRLYVTGSSEFIDYDADSLHHLEYFIK